MRRAKEPQLKLDPGHAEAVSALALFAVLAFAVARPRGRPEAAAAIPAAALVAVVGAVTAQEAWTQTRTLLPVVAFLAVVLLLADLCAAEGLFEAVGARVARWCVDKPRALLRGVFAIASLTTAVLSLDATVVLLTPVVLAAADAAKVDRKPSAYAVAHLANSASLLLPVSNLTNLLAFAASGLTFTRFAGLMALPWLLAIGVEYAVFRLVFRAELRDPPVLAEADAAAVPQAAPGRGRATVADASVGAGADADIDVAMDVDIPRFPLVVVALTLGGFAVTSFAGASPVWAACAGTAVLSVHALRRRYTSARRMFSAAGLLFCLFVLALGIVVKAVVDNGLGAWLARIPALAGPGAGSGHGAPTLLALLAVALLAAGLANVINNLPAVLALLPVAVAQVASAGPGLVLAVLIGVNLGPNLTYAGSLATLLWRRALNDHGTAPRLALFTRLGLLAAPATLGAATVGLWAALRVLQ